MLENDHLELLPPGVSKIYILYIIYIRIRMEICWARQLRLRLRHTDTEPSYINRKGRENHRGDYLHEHQKDVLQQLFVFGLFVRLCV